MSFLGHSQLYTQPSDFYKAIYAIRENGSTRGMACAVINGRQVLGQESRDNTRGSICLVTSSGCIGEYESQSFKVDRYSKKKMGRYQLEISNIIQTENFSFLLVNGNDSSKKLNVKYLTDEEQKRDFIVYTISASERLDRLILKYNQVTENYNLIVPENRFDFFLRGSPIIVDETYFVGVLKKSDPGQFKPCFATEEEFENSEPVEGNQGNSEHVSEPEPEPENAPEPDEPVPVPGPENVTEPDELRPEPEARVQEREPRHGLDVEVSLRSPGGWLFSCSLRLTVYCVIVVATAAVLIGLEAVLVCWKAVPIVWNAFLVCWKAVPIVWNAVFVCWKAVPIVWNAVFMCWKAVPIVWNAVFMCWKAVLILWNAVFWGLEAVSKGLAMIFNQCLSNGSKGTASLEGPEKMPTTAEGASSFPRLSNTPWRPTPTTLPSDEGDSSFPRLSNTPWRATRKTLSSDEGASSFPRLSNTAVVSSVPPIQLETSSARCTVFESEKFNPSLGLLYEVEKLTPSPGVLYEVKKLAPSPGLLYEVEKLNPSPGLLYEVEKLNPSPGLLYEVEKLNPCPGLLYEVKKLAPSPGLLYEVEKLNPSPSLLYKVKKLAPSPGLLYKVEKLTPSLGLLHKGFLALDKKSKFLQIR